MTDEDLRAEGEPEREFHEGIAARLPRKRVAAGALIRGASGRFLMIQPTYKPGWEIPGGVVEENEDPLEGCVREIREELELDLHVGSLLVVDWAPQHGVWGDAMHLIFDGGILDENDLAKARLQADEVKSAAFVNLAETAEHVRPSMLRRLQEALSAAEEGRTAYLQFGRRPVNSDQGAERT